MSDWSDSVIVIGAGLSGGSAALTLLEAGVKVTLVEKEKRLGGNSVRASSGINASETHHQKDQNVPDTNALFAHDTIYSATKNLNAKPNALTLTLARNSASGVKWLEQHKLSLPVLSQCGGHSAARTHRPTTGAAGGYITLGLMRYIKKYVKTGQCRLLKRSKLTNLVKDYNNNVVGIEYVDLKKGTNNINKIYGKSVIISTGGFCYNKQMLLKYSPLNAHVGTTNGPWTMGEGMLVAEKCGAGLVDMDAVQVHPTGFIDPKDPTAHEKILAAECLRASGALLINEKGHRFTNELGHRDDVTSAERGQKGKVRLIINPVAIKQGQIAPHVNMYKGHFGVLKPYKNAYELAESMNIPVENLIDTFNRYNESAKSGWCPSGKPRFPGAPYKADQELVVGFVQPVLHYVMGGIKINEHAEVIDKKGNIMNGLYASGEAAGGVHGRNRLAGNSLVDCVVYGRVAANSVLKKLGKGGLRSKL